MRKFKVFIYRFMSAKQLCKKIDVNSVLLDTTKDSKMRMKIIDDNFAVLEAIIRKNRNDKELMDYIKTSLEETANKHKKKLEESK